MENIQFISVSPSELTDTITSKISEVLGGEFERILQEHLEDYLQVKKEKDFLTRNEAAEMLSLSFSGLYKLINKENIKVHKVGRKPYFKRQDILDLLERKSAA